MEVERVLSDRSVEMACQPIVSLHDGRLSGVEALARFPEPPARSPDRWFSKAHAVGLGVELEMKAAELAIGLLPSLADDVFLSVNVSPPTVIAGAVSGLLSSTDPGRVVLELTEHTQVDDYVELEQALAPIRKRGTRLAVDDAGGGFASLAHILRLAPDIIKLDRRLIVDVDVDPARRALATALLAFAEEVQADVIAEGIETAAQRDCLESLGVSYGQGYLLGRPGPLRPHMRQYSLV
jgi:EAL domain-containing protein (putative c-di-GMP-specific phosphodiesterase class I)